MYGDENLILTKKHFHQTENNGESDVMYKIERSCPKHRLTYEDSCTDAVERIAYLMWDKDLMLFGESIYELDRSSERKKTAYKLESSTVK